MLKQIIRERLAQCGINKAELAQKIGSTPNQLGLFLRDDYNVSLQAIQLEALLKELNMNLEQYHKRYQLSNEIAVDLLNRGFKTEDVALWSRAQFVIETNHVELKFLIEVDLSDFSQIMETGIVDIECTFPFFRSLVVQQMKLLKADVAPTRKNIRMAHSVIEKELDLNTRVLASLIMSNASLALGLLENSITGLYQLTARLLGLEKISK